MTRYTVVWDKEVEEPFMNAWWEADSNRRAILTGISNWIDRILAEDPEHKGQTLSEPLHRVLKARDRNSNVRVAVTYRVFPGDRLIRVTLLVIRDR
jgi:hypothetical protein